MRIFDGFGQRISLAMAGKKSPWGGGSGDDGDSDGGKPTGSEGGDKPKGPRNPWLPPGSGGGSGDGRRGPNIEDIFKSRGPEGPRRRAVWSSSFAFSRIRCVASASLLSGGHGWFGPIERRASSACSHGA